MSRDADGWQGKAERAYAQLRADIETGTLPPGQVLSEVELVEYTGASRTPVREAIRRLANEGLIELAPRRAPIVSRISLRGARDLFDFRRLLEPAAIALVTERLRDDASLAEPYERLRERFERLKGQAYSPAFQEEFTAMTAEFDRLLASHVPNEYLARSITDLRPHSARLRHIAHADVTRLHEAIEEHIEMCADILMGEATRAAEAMTRHLHHVDQAIFHRLLHADAEVLVS
ncbi:GntR family transcriptional regulator [Microbacterium sp. 5K110]|jgi:DNA-binding GntR family transcriptional regulator|uniref:GntR family transcriptional regulator n=1 Tax=unclassified Microbacterium TaxID=2609290 RepID=UPI0010FED081|nr:GntR family transcriptional regulator [Microbacterium sp. 5K110]TLF30906.1 GntR family transcriptional regulator [Microbacterium sp. 5K110]